MKTVIIPQRNEPDLDDVPAEVLSQLDVHAVANVREVLELALTPASTPGRPLSSSRGTQGDKRLRPGQAEA